MPASASVGDSYRFLCEPVDFRRFCIGCPATVEPDGGLLRPERQPLSIPASASVGGAARALAERPRLIWFRCSITGAPARSTLPNFELS